MAKKIDRLELPVARFLDLLSATSRPNTMQRYRLALRLFVGYLKREHPGVTSFSKLRRTHIEAWLRDLATRVTRTGKPLQKNSRRLRIIMVRHFLKEIAEHRWKGAPTTALFQKGDVPAEDYLLPRPLSRDTDRQLQKVLRSQGGLLPTSLLLLRHTGLRCQELLDLKTDALEKVSEDCWTLRVPLGKLHSERVIPVDEQAAKLFRALCRLRGNPPPVADPTTGQPVHFLVVHEDGRPWSRWTLRSVLLLAVSQARIKEHVHPHRLRHTYATEMVRAGMNLLVLMRILGHRTLRMTMRYVEVTQVDVQRAYAQAMEAIAHRYPFPVFLPKVSKKDAQPHEALLSLLRSAASAIEAFRRDRAKSPRQEKALQRLAERIRRLARDFRALST